MRRGIRTSLLVLAMASTALTPARGQILEVIDFEDHPANPVGTPGVSLDPDFYAERGVRFSLGATVLQYDAGFSSSGTHGLEMCYSAEFCSTPFSIGFDSPQQTVTVAVGYSGSLDETVPVVMVAYDINETPVDDDEIVLGPGSPVPIFQQLSVGPIDPQVAEELGSDGLISAVEIRWLDDTRGMNSLAIDDLAYEPFVPFVGFETEPAELSFHSSGEFSDVSITNVGNVPAIFDMGLSGDTEAFVLDEAGCRVGLPPGASCVVGVGFEPAEEGDYSAGIVLISRQPEQNHVIPVAGSLAPVVDTPPTTEPGEATAATDPRETTVVTQGGDTVDTDGSTVTSEAIAVGPGGDGADDPDLMMPLTLVIILVAVGGGAMLFRLRPGRSNHQGPTQTSQAAVEVSPNRSTSEVTVLRSQPVTAVRVVSDRGFTTLMEDDRR